MPTPIDPKRLPALKATHASLGDDETLSQRKLAEIYGVTPARLVNLIKFRFESFPPPERHKDKSYWYQAKAAVAAMISYMEKGGNVRKSQAARHAAIMSGTPAAPTTAAYDEGPQPLSAGEIDRLASAQTRIWKLQVSQGLYVKADDMRHVARRVNALISRDVINLVNVIDPNGRLDGELRQRIEKECRTALVKMHAEMGELLDDVGERPGAAAFPGAGSDRHDQPRRGDQRRGSVETAA